MDVFALKAHEKWEVPGSWPQIPKLWWDYIFDGRLWAVDLDKMPPVPTERTKLTYVRKYILGKGVRYGHWVSTRFGATSIETIYVQSRGRVGENQVDAKAARLPLSAAMAAPALPLAPPKYGRKITNHPDSPAAEIIPQLPDFAEEARQLWDDFKSHQPMTPVPPRALVHHTRIGWIAQVCDCGTDNFRLHPATCGAAHMIGFLAHQVLDQPVPPERWAQRYADPWD